MFHVKHFLKWKIDKRINIFIQELEYSLMFYKNSIIIAIVYF